MGQVKKYFKGLLNSYDSEVLQQVLVDLIDCKNKVTRDLRSGLMEVNEDQTNLQQILLTRSSGNQLEYASKRQLMQKEIESLNPQQFENEEQYKRAKQQIILKRQMEIQEEKEQKQRKRKQVEERVKKWTLEQKQIIKKREQKLNQQQKVRQIETEQSKIKAEEEKQKQMSERRKQIEQNLKKLQEERNRRVQLLKNIRSQSQDKLPLYIEYEKKAKKQEEEKIFEQYQQKKNHKLSRRIDYDELKMHQRLFLTKIEERKRRFQEQAERASSSIPEGNFTLFTNRSQEKIKEEAEKKSRRWKYQQKLKEIPIQIDEAKRVKIEIALDKSKNPFKYNFLSQKSLNQFQIYGEFKNFSINTNAREIGKGYLEQLKSVPKQSRAEKSSSIQLIKQSTVSDRPQYRNYLAQLKSKKPSQKQAEKDQIQKIVKNSKNKDRAVQKLQKKSQQLETDLQKKMYQLKSLSSKNLREILKKQSEVDQIYTNGLKARLACLELS